MNRLEELTESLQQELGAARVELARLADVERELVFWRARAQAAEAAASQWRTVQNRTLWKLCAALDQLRDSIAPSGTRRERLILGAARGAAKGLTHVVRTPERGITQRTVRQFAPQLQKDVLFIYGGDNAWKIYRCDHQAEQLGYLGMSSDAVKLGAIDLLDALDRYDLFILNRIEWDERVEAFIASVRDTNKTVIFDCDDLIFEPELAAHFAFLDAAEPGVRNKWRHVLEGFQRTLSSCDAATVSTDPLAGHARNRAHHVEVAYNTVSSEMVRRADVLRRRSFAETHATGRDLVIGYLSGTPSHNRDFLEAADAVVWALETHEHVRFLIVGHLDLDKRFEPFESRITRIPIQPFRDLPKLAALIDINLAPLERENPFTNCKSCVKYLEAGLVGVPTIASARPDFVRVIESGVNGSLADSPSEWQQALQELIESPERRRDMGERASKDVRENHTTKASAPLLGRVLAECQQLSVDKT